MTQTKESYDVAIVGSGPGGYVAAVRCAQLGLKTICIEKNATFGGTCLNVGCIPSKALLQITEWYSFFTKKAASQGILAKEISYDFNLIMQRKQEIVTGLVNSVANLFKQHAVTSLNGVAHFVSPTTLEVVNGEKRQIIEAKSIILATGSEPIPMPKIPFDEKIILSSTGTLSLPSVPKKMVVIGAGVIGVELASVYRRLGSEVVVVEMLNQICISMDETISKMLLQLLQKQGIVFHLGAKVTEMKVQSDQTASNGVKIFVQLPNQTVEEMEANVVLVAIGRRPYTESLDLKNANVTRTEKGFIEVDSCFRTTQPHIYAIGDLIDGPMLAHRASQEATVVAEFIAGQKSSIDYITIPNVIYTHPEAAAVGLTEKEAKDASIKTKIGKAFFKGNPRARCAQDTDGLVKIIGDMDENRLIGMHIIGSHASELIGIGAFAMSKRATLSEVANLCYSHPSLSETIKEAAIQAVENSH